MIEDIRTLMSGLLFSCPYSEDNPTECPFHELRNKTSSEIYHEIQKLSNEKKEELVKKHKLCLTLKEQYNC